IGSQIDKAAQYRYLAAPRLGLDRLLKTGERALALCVQAVLMYGFEQGMRVLLGFLVQVSRQAGPVGIVKSLSRPMLAFDGQQTHVLALYGLIPGFKLYAALG